ncbi:NXPE family member 3-like [Physella acuta]|uniref:NXPE family member 3-like n=1 Tax=Physella acuta TaxID=109671 RepID=UPI0027DCBC7C|nr:NXPE family member 3-like [Physella acuta]
MTLTKTSVFTALCVLYRSPPIGISVHYDSGPEPKLEPLLQHGSHDVHFSQATDKEFWDDGPIDIYEAFAQHSYKTLDTCNNSCDYKDDLCEARTMEKFDSIISRNLIQKPKPFLARGQYVFEWEKKYLSYPPLNDSKTLPDLELSKVTVENTRQGVVRCKILETIHFRLDVVDGYGRQRTKGDDVVRVWMKGGNNSDYAVVGNVTDLQNGSYTFSVKCLWAGISKLHVAIAYPREFIRTVIHQDTICFHTPNIPGWECICNFSKFGYENYYCGRPRHPSQAAERLVENNYLIVTENTVAENLVHLQSCRESNKRVTWSQTTPKGFWSPGHVWSSLVCKDPGVINSSWTLNCLRDSSVWIFGDSNARETYNYLLNLTQCEHVQGGYQYWGHCFQPMYSLSINVNSHEGPKYTHAWSSDYFTVPSFIQKLPKNQKHILIIQYYLHYTAAHLAVLSLRMKSLRAAIEKLLEENPNVLIGLRGPHISTWQYNENHAIGGDALGQQYMEIIRERFKGLEDKVVLLDLWEMTIGIENADFHPPAFVNREMIKFLLSFQCL